MRTVAGWTGEEILADMTFVVPHEGNVADEEFANAYSKWRSKKSALKLGASDFRVPFRPATAGVQSRGSAARPRGQTIDPTDSGPVGLLSITHQSHMLAGQTEHDDIS
jgi:hypothetical protein